MQIAELRDHPFVYVDDLDQPVMADRDVHHFERVLRIRPGDPIVVGDGAGGWRPARFDPRPELTGDGGRVERPETLVTVAFTPVKGERAEWFAQKLTEVGVDEIVPIVTARSVVRWADDRAAKQLERMTVVAREACLQSRRLHRPVVAPLTPFDRFIATHPEAALADPAGGQITPTQQTLVIGPEGGFTDDERSLAPTVALPGNVLRATTAAVVAGATACGLRDGTLGAGRA
jgi:16S rRNA (uracil1498-N3)-methyltransferase